MARAEKKHGKAEKPVSGQQHNDPPSNSDSAVEGVFLKGETEIRLDNDRTESSPDDSDGSALDRAHGLILLSCGICLGRNKLDRKDDQFNEVEEPVRRIKNKESILEKWNNVTKKWIDEIQRKEDDVGVGVLDTDVKQVMEPSHHSKTKLLTHQKEWLAWAVKQENSLAKGGILADEMGMGKTLEAISLVLSNGLTNRRGTSQRNSTLVVCPVVALKHWESEITRHTVDGSTKVLVYRGTKRDKSLIKSSEYDLVLTTYTTVGTEYKSRLPCMLQSSNTKKQEDEPDGKYNVAARKDKKLQQELKCNDTQMLSIHELKWHRIILDEAHYITRRSSNIAKATRALTSTYRWALTGTPIQNTIEELYSLICFLRVFPYSYYICNVCGCASLTQDCSISTCGHIRSDHFCWWKRFVRKPMSAHHEDGRKRVLTLLKNGVLRSILLRRTKDRGATNLTLPPKTVFLRLDSLDENEQDCYEYLYEDLCRQVNEYFKGRNYMIDYARIFKRLTQLRQAINHQYLITLSCQEHCRICTKLAKDPLVASCKHFFCNECLKGHKFSGNSGCPSCTCEPRSLVKDFRRWNILDDVQLESFETSTKVEALREEIMIMITRDGSAKGLVFSQFTQFLDLIGYALEESGIHCTKLVGSMTKDQKDGAVKKFNDEPDCRILLLSMNVGGVALDLTVASHVFLMEPWWNAAPELHTQDRVYRIGQYKPVRVVRFIIENTIEERILKLQEKKKAAIDCIISSASKAQQKLTKEDLKYLFDYHESSCPPEDSHQKGLVTV